MTFKEFSQAIKKDPRLMELLNKCDRSCGPMSDEETQELVDRTELACMAFSDEYQPEDFINEYEDPLEFESPIDLYGAWWE